jgi:succinate dehydrogenase / fumarate reductase flavoprotein subunit
MNRQINCKNVELYARREMLDFVLVNGVARGITVRNLVTGEIESHSADAVLLCTGGYGNAYYLSTNAMNSNVTASWRCHRRGAYFGNPCFTQIHPTCIPRSGTYQSKLTLMSESLRNDGRVWVPKTKGDKRRPQDIPESERDYYLERIYPSFGNLVPRDVASRQAKFRVDEARGVGSTGEAVYLDFSDAIKRLGHGAISEKYGNLFEIYEQITGENPYEVPMRIYPAVHYTMGGLWVDYNLMSTVPGLHVLGEANFSDHGANRLGASALMQGLADGYFVIPYTLGHYIASANLPKVDTNHDAFKASREEVTQRLNKLLTVKGQTTVDTIHKELGDVMWQYVGMSRNAAGLKTAIEKIKGLRQKFWSDVRVTGDRNFKNADFHGGHTFAKGAGGFKKNS